MNPVQSVFCSECGGQLLSSSGEGLGAEAAPTIKGLSLPTKGPAGQAEPPEAAPEAEDQEEVPGWLRELGAARASAGEAETAAQREDQADVPDWLQDLRASFPTEEEAATPPPPEEQDVPDWLSRLRPITGAQPPADFEPQEEDVPDWLAQIRPPAATETGGPPAAPEAEEEDIPDWLAELRPLAAEEASDSALTGEEDVPDWLAELHSSSRAVAPKQAAAPMADEAEVPDWLAELRSTSRAVAPEQAAAPAAEGEEVPDWLAGLRSVPGVDSPEPVPPEAEVEIPDWLAGLRPGGGAEAAEEESLPDWLAELRPAASIEAPEPAAGPKAEEDELPDWLAGLRPAAGPETAEPAAVPEAEEEDVPHWLAELRPAARAEAAEPEEGADRPAEQGGEGESYGPTSPPKAEEADIPDWLSAMRPKPEVKEPTPGLTAGEDQPEEEEEDRPHWLVEAPPEKESAGPVEIAAAEMPGWLQELEPGGLEKQPSPATAQDSGEDLPAWLVPSTRETDDESLARAEIPEWLLALKPAELREQGEPEGPTPFIVEPVEETGLLAGLRGTLPVEMLIAQPRAVAAAEPPQSIQHDTSQARLFAEIVGRGPEAVPKAVPQPRQSLLARLPLWITYLALLGAITLPLLLQNPMFERSIEPPARVLDLYESVEALDPARPALVAFDYDPSSSEEMNILARAVVGHLLDRGVPVVAMSLQPAGPPVAQSVLEELAAERPGVRYANVGYLSGQAAAVQLLGQGFETTLLQDFRDLASTDPEIVRGVTGLESFGLLLVLAAEPDGLRIWIEQAGALQGAPLAAAVSASTEPLARSYYETDPRQLLGLVAGVPGAATYEALRRGDGTLPAEMAARLDSHLAGHAVFVLVLVVGNLAYLVRRGPRGRR